MANQNAIGNIQLNKANNLSDLASKVTAAQNLPVRSIIASQTTNYTHPGGTTNNLVMASLLIPANTMGANDSLVFDGLVTKAATAAQVTVRWYLAPSAGTPGSVIPGTSVQIAMPTAMGTTTLFGKTQRTLIAQGATNSQIIFTATGGGNTDTNTSTIAASTLAIDMTVDQYFIVAAQLANTGDSCVMRWAQVSLDKAP